MGVAVLFGPAASGKTQWARENGREEVFDYLDLERVLRSVKALERVAISVHPAMPRECVDAVAAKTLQLVWTEGMTYDLYEFKKEGPPVVERGVAVRKYQYRA